MQLKFSSELLKFFQVIFNGLQIGIKFSPVKQLLKADVLYHI